MDETFLTVQDVADALRVHPNTVKNWLRSGEFPNAIHKGKVIRIPLSDIEALKSQPFKKAEGA